VSSGDSGPAFEETAPGTDDTVASPGRARATAVEAPRTLGRYQIGERLGAGGMGQVFRAHDPQLNREVAIKILHPGGDTGSQARELEQRLLREAQAMARLSHTNLAIVHDVGSDRGEVFLAMELIDGETLRAWLQRPRPWRDALAALIAAGRGLAAAHSAGVIHRDFKPDNVLVARDGTVKVVDFGLARGVGERDGASAEQRRADVLQSSMTVTGAVMGTPAYMAPEQQIGEPTDASADQFSLAVSIYEGIYGARPFPQGALAAFRAGAERAPAPPADRGVPPAVFDVLVRGLAREPEDRYPSVTAFLDALVAAAPPERPRRRRVVPIAIAAGVVIAGGGALAIWQLRDDDGGPGVPADAPAEIIAVIRAHLDELEACHKKALRKDPTLPGGTVQITFEIGKDGRVTSTRLDGGAAPSPELAGCVAGASMSWQFPPQDGALRVTYPFEFAPMAAPEVTRVDATTFRIPRRQFDAWMADPTPLELARFIPSKKDGAMFGMKVYAVIPGTALEALGLMNGDTLIEINGQSLALDLLDDAETIMALEKSVRAASTITITLVRRGERLQLRYEVVE
jgi:hypothetical protein